MKRSRFWARSQDGQARSPARAPVSFWPWRPDWGEGGAPSRLRPFWSRPSGAGRRTAIDPTRTVVEATDFLSTAGLAGEPQLALRLIERAVTPHLAGVLARRIGAALPIEDTPDDAFAVTVLRPDDIVARARALIPGRLLSPHEPGSLRPWPGSDAPAPWLDVSSPASA